MMARLIRTLSKNGNQVKSYYTDTNFRMYKDLMSHFADLKNDTKRMEHFESLCGVLYEFMNGDILPNTVDLMEMFGKMCINSFNICNEEQQTLGTGIYLGASVIDHSCKPNAIAMFEGTTLHIRATKPMAYLNWSEIRISYIDVLNTRKDRIEELERLYYFTCQCPMCSIPDPIEMNAAACPNRDCYLEINLNETNIEKCSRCEAQITSTFREKFAEVNKLTDLHLQNMKELAHMDNLDLDACEVFLEKQGRFLYSSNIKRVKTLDLAFESFIHFGKFEDALRVGLSLLPPLTKYYGITHPVDGLIRLKMAKLFAALNNTECALKLAESAHDVLKVTHGMQSDIVREELLPLLKH
ncbi:hypothetical protein WA026_023547 [Henosepilachna vigintioctopunctata]